MERLTLCGTQCHQSRAEYSPRQHKRALCFYKQNVKEHLWPVYIVFLRQRKRRIDLCASQHTETQYMTFSSPAQHMTLIRYANFIKTRFVLEGFQTARFLKFSCKLICHIMTESGEKENRWKEVEIKTSFTINGLEMCSHKTTLLTADQQANRTSAHRG